ncbi:hypothetical protein [Calothrix sp. FACHB-168]|uniref:hypothetical protein n=1 Tax=Calothrix sp. FACHB-168 TaxID=2692780 RepID=UPI001A7E7BE2|nr:hypothetical protein [Calothrix sp. FACHB-168]
MLLVFFFRVFLSATTAYIPLASDVLANHGDERRQNVGLIGDRVALTKSSQKKFVEPLDETEKQLLS